jgi:osmoprotectant transport system ATP-binding protein
VPGLVELRDVSYRIGEVDVLRDISLSIEEGETLVLLGRSGSGKTTLLKMINRLVQPTSGEIFLDGTPLSETDPIKLRRRIGYVIQDGGLFPHVTVERNVGLVPTLEEWPEEKVRARTAELLDAMKLPPSIYATRYPRELSGGEKQRVGIARALAADPPLLLLDEPFAALDPVTRFEMQQQFLELRRQFRKTAVFVTHDIREALMLGSRIALLHKGGLEVVTTVHDFPSVTSGEAKAFLATIADGWQKGESHAHS